MSDPAAIAALERHIARRDKLAERSTRLWVEAAEKALALIPGHSRSDHPAHSLYLRVELAKAPPVEVVLS